MHASTEQSGNNTPLKWGFTVITDQLQTLAVYKIVVKKSGFLYVYTSNESGQDVYFDNVTVAMQSGPVLEETHYYSFGLVMKGISSKAVDKLEGKQKFNNAELNKEFDLNIYEFNYRFYDPQIGRWNSLDNKPTDNISLYVGFANNSVRYSDPLGDTVALLRPDGTFWRFNDDGKKEWSGIFYQKSSTHTFEKDGVTYNIENYSDGQVFQFNDPDADVLAIKNGAITNIAIMSDDKVEIS